MAQQQIAEAAGSVAAKFQAFHDGLTPEEQRALDAALRQAGAAANEPAKDAEGYMTPIWLPLIVARIVQELKLLEGAQPQPAPTSGPRGTRE